MFSCHRITFLLISNISCSYRQKNKMESNKEESYRCLDLAEKAWRSGDKEKAERLAKKAQKLYPSNESKGKTLIFQIQMRSK